MRACEDAGLDKLGINKTKTIYKNLTFAELFKHESENVEGVFAETKSAKTFLVDTGKFTGRSPKDKFVVRRVGTESDKNFWWGNVNQPTTPEVFNDLLETAIDRMNSKEKLYVADVFCGADVSVRKKVRFVHEMAWQQHFVTNMFIRPTSLNEIAADDDIDFTIINACSASNEKWKEHGLNSEVAIVFDIERKLGVILGTYYGGENKKGVFGLMNYWLPFKNILPMHCSANVGRNGDSALFFGLSGTGKTTLSADPDRSLLGDDEHGWNDEGIFNFEGGCYAKTINLSEKSEPDIFRAITRNAMLENVAIDKEGAPDYFDTTKTQNGRVSYPIFHIPGYHSKQTAGHPTKLVFLTCDAFGVLPPVARLTSGQALYQFISGYTSKVAGTERGVTEPEATFSACFGAAFLTLHPLRYAELLQQKIEAHGTEAFLVNTGWSGGSYGIGERMPLKVTREIIDCILDGSINNSEFQKDAIFGLEVPKTLGTTISRNILDPRESWTDKDLYDKTATKLSEMFKANFKKYEGGDVGVGGEERGYSKFGPL